MDKTGFVLPELIIESVIRDGIANVRQDLTIIDDVFRQLTRQYNNAKYGTAEIAKIKTLIQKEIAVVFDYAEVDAKSPCFSIMIGSDVEDKRRAHLNDHYKEETTPITDPDEIDALIRVNNLVVSAYDPMTGKVTVSLGTDLMPVYRGMIYVDAANTEFEIIKGIIDTPTEKAFFIQTQAEVDFTDFGYIKSSLDYKQYEIKGVTGDEQIVVGAHSKDALTTKYLYILLKYFLLSRKKDLILRGFVVASYSGSDFHRDNQYVADSVKVRFLTITGKIDDTWRSDQVIPIDNIVLDAKPVECPPEDE